MVTLGYKKPGICVDTHVHRISNRWGYVNTKTPEKTEIALRAKLPKQYWIEYNDLLVSFGQHLCRPISPVCSDCPVKNIVGQIGVTRGDEDGAKNSLRVISLGISNRSAITI